ncbi:hypothetical protein [Halomarina oriensis]|uniref:Uncharacterized protein n=1 Tax=Halomarina oriensis TaxID=671145 RepID=A0A6B0GPC0_9EURY|nr:hypothetical protein [Halomarina oriensis]MWG36664.1 hypothetical protein [Halomarina oriensis]
MNRRALLSALAVGGCGLAGCLGMPDSLGTDETPPSTTTDETSLPTRRTELSADREHG